MAKQKNVNPEELRYNYLGFEVEPGKLKEFWASDDEKKSYVEKIRAQFKKSQSIERDFSVVNANQINKADRVIISIASLLMIISLFLPYYRFDAFGSMISGSAVSYLINMGYIESSLDDYKALVKDAKYVCKRCGRSANSNESLCRPVKI